jgi:glutaredoxin-like protein NrdH
MNNITVYTLPNCVQCNQTKKTFDRLGVKYETVDASTSEEAYRFITEELKYKSAPVVVVRNDTGIIVEHWNGFEPDKIALFNL